MTNNVGQRMLSSASSMNTETDKQLSQALNIGW